MYYKEIPPYTSESYHSAWALWQVYKFSRHGGRVTAWAGADRAAPPSFPSAGSLPADWSMSMLLPNGLSNQRRLILDIIQLKVASLFVSLKYSRWYSSPILIFFFRFIFMSVVLRRTCCILGKWCCYRLLPCQWGKPTGCHCTEMFLKKGQVELS